MQKEPLVTSGGSKMTLQTTEIEPLEVFSIVMKAIDATTKAAANFLSMQVAEGVSTYVEEMIEALHPVIENMPGMTPQIFEEKMKEGQEDLDKMGDDLEEAQKDFENFKEGVENDDEGVAQHFLLGVGKVLARLAETAEHVFPSDIAEQVEAYLNSVSDVLEELGDSWDDFLSGEASDQSVAALDLARAVNKAVKPLLPEKTQQDMDYQKIYTGLDASLKMLSETVLKWTLKVSEKSTCKREEEPNKNYKDPDDCTTKDNGDERIGYVLDSSKYKVNVCLPVESTYVDKKGGRKERIEVKTNKFKKLTAKKLTKEEGAQIEGAQYPNCQTTGSYTRQAVLKDLGQTKCFEECPEGDNVTHYTIKEKNYRVCYQPCPPESSVPTGKFCSTSSDALESHQKNKKNQALYLVMKLAGLAADISYAVMGKEELKVVEGAVSTVGAILDSGAEFYTPRCV